MMTTPCGTEARWALEDVVFLLRVPRPPGAALMDVITPFLSKRVKVWPGLDDRFGVLEVPSLRGHPRIDPAYPDEVEVMLKSPLGVFRIPTEGTEYLSRLRPRLSDGNSRATDHRFPTIFLSYREVRA